MGGRTEDPVVKKMLAHAIVAGGLSRGARDYPDAAKGLLKAAQAHSERAARLAEEVAGRVGARPTTR